MHLEHQAANKWLNPQTDCRSWTSEAKRVPLTPDLDAFHRDDRKYVAVALVSQNHPTVVNAVDTDWWEHREVLKRNGVHLRFLCPQHMK